MKVIPKNKKLVLFDGVCNLCNDSVQFIIRHDQKDVFRFASLQSEVGKQVIAEYLPDLQGMSSIVLLEEDQVFLKSTAALKIADSLNSFSWMSFFLKLPRSWRDFIYDLIAKNRYKLFGKKEHCMIPTTELKAKFIED